MTKKRLGLILIVVAVLTWIFMVHDHFFDMFEHMRSFGDGAYCGWGGGMHLNMIPVILLIVGLFIFFRSKSD